MIIKKKLLLVMNHKKMREREREKEQYISHQKNRDEIDGKENGTTISLSVAFLHFLLRASWEASFPWNFQLFILQVKVTDQPSK